MQTVNATNELGSGTGSGQSAMASLGQKVLSLFRGSKKNPVDNFKIKYVTLHGPNEALSGWYIVKYEDEILYAGPYKREKDAKGQLTRLRKGYTPAARKV